MTAEQAKKLAENFVHKTAFAFYEEAQKTIEATASNGGYSLIIGYNIAMPPSVVIRIIELFELDGFFITDDSESREFAIYWAEPKVSE